MSLENILRILFAVLFLFFAFLQWNDPDPLLWMINYGLAAVLSIKAITKFKFANWIFRLTLGFIGVQTMVLAVKVFGKQHLIHTEDGREFLGLLIVFLWLFWLDLKAD